MNEKIPYNSFSVITFKANNKQPTVKYEYYSLDNLIIESNEEPIKFSNISNSSLQSITLNKNEKTMLSFFYIIEENNIIKIKEMSIINEDDNILGGPFTSLEDCQNELIQLASNLSLQKISNMEYKA